MEWSRSAEIYEYASNANPPMSEVPVRVFPPTLHTEGPSRVEPFDVSADLEVDYPATSPNLLASFVRVVEGEQLDTGINTSATSQAFYVIRGSGESLTRAGNVKWETGDMFVLPYLGDHVPAVCTTGTQCVVHQCTEEKETGGC